ncbi:MAG: amidohydrolase family protein [Bacteroidetes bacterium]|nr:amidohydrolase family protein [Bacteroidota bacterium]
MNLLLKNIYWASDGKNITTDIRISRGVISEIGTLSSLKREKTIDFKNHFLYPGLINSHDHLEMNLYPLMGNPFYNNYTEWAQDIYKPTESPVKEIEGTGIKDRLIWGGIKNLISGVTTVVHHNPWNRHLSKKKFPVKVKETAWAHSLVFEKNIQKKIPKKSLPFVIHAAEGLDDFAQHEILKLNGLGLLRANTVLIHAVALNEENKKLIEQTEASVIWCPSSNLFMFGKTAPVDEIKIKTKVALGTDSTMTGSPTLLDEMRVARNTNLATPKEIYEMVTSIPAKIFGLERPEIKIGNRADFWISPIIHEDYLENIFKIDSSKIRAVFVNGKFRFGDADLATDIGADGYQLSWASKWIAYDIFSLKKRIESKTKDACNQNPLWKMFFGE